MGKTVIKAKAETDQQWRSSILQLVLNDGIMKT
jgi:hypothetical protein